MVRPGAVVRGLILSGLALSTLAFAKTNKTIVTYPTFAVSGPVADMPVEYSMFPFQAMPEPRPNPNKAQPGPYEDPIAQKEAGRNLDIAIGVNFDGIGSPGYAPSDSNMAIGPTDIVEVVNVDFQVFNKTGGSIAGPTSITNIFASLAGDCSSGTDGDPVVLYDRAADRWLLSMIGSGSTTSECVAVSKTNDPTGAYYLYGYSFGAELERLPEIWHVGHRQQQRVPNELRHLHQFPKLWRRGPLWSRPNQDAGWHCLSSPALPDDPEQRVQLSAVRYGWSHSSS